MIEVAAPKLQQSGVNDACLKVVDGRGNYFVINPAAFHRNVAALRAIIGRDVRIMQVVKGDGYGIGVERTVALGQSAGLDGFCAGTPEESMKIRAIAPDADAMLFTSCQPETLIDLVRRGVIVTVNSLEAFRPLLASGVSGKIYFELECGFGRFGIEPDDLEEAIGLYLSQSQLKLAGVYTHFGRFVGDQLENGLVAFDAGIESVRNRVSHPFETMCAGSHTILQRPSLPYSAVDPGSLLYGIVPADFDEIFRPVVEEVGSHIIQIKDFRAGDNATFGYGNNRVDFSGGGKTAVFPLGWHDGLSTSLDRGEVIVAGRRCPVLGRTLLHSIIDVSAIEHVVVGDKVILVGGEASEQSLSWTEASVLQATSSTELHFKLTGSISVYGQVGSTREA